MIKLNKLNKMIKVSELTVKQLLKVSLKTPEKTRYVITMGNSVIPRQSYKIVCISAPEVQRLSNAELDRLEALIALVKAQRDLARKANQFKKLINK